MLNWLKKKTESSRTDESKGKSSTPAWRPSRVRLDPVHGVRVSLNSHPGQTVEVINISVTGIGFRRPALPADVREEKTLSGCIELVGLVFGFEATVVHATDEVTGCRFDRIDAEFASAFLRFFNAECTGFHLIEMSPELIRQDDPEGKKRCFQGRGCEVSWVERADGSVASFDFVFLGNVYEWEPGRRLRCRLLLDPEQKGRAVYKGSLLLGKPARLTPAMAEAARRFVVSVPQLPDAPRDVILLEIARAVSGMNEVA